MQCPEGSSVELACPIGKYCSSPGAEPTPCPVSIIDAYYCATNSTTYDLCAAGFYCPSNTEIMSCPSRSVVLMTISAPLPHMHDIPPAATVPIT